MRRLGHGLASTGEHSWLPEELGLSEVWSSGTGPSVPSGGPGWASAFYLGGHGPGFLPQPCLEDYPKGDGSDSETRGVGGVEMPSSWHCWQPGRGPVTSVRRAGAGA